MMKETEHRANVSEIFASDGSRLVCRVCGERLDIIDAIVGGADTVVCNQCREELTS